jgi:hypothetical protein
LIDIAIIVIYGEIKIKQVFSDDFDKVMAIRSPDSIYGGADIAEKLLIWG